jgi:hypothetical protein
LRRNESISVGDETPRLAIKILVPFIAVSKATETGLSLWLLGFSATRKTHVNLWQDRPTALRALVGVSDSKCVVAEEQTHKAAWMAYHMGQLPKSACTHIEVWTAGVYSGLR